MTMRKYVPAARASSGDPASLGPLTRQMLTDTPLLEVWLINFVANMFVGPVYRHLSDNYGLSRPEFVILFCLSQRPGIAAKDICEATGHPKNSISRAVADLLQKGFIARSERPEDRRSKSLTITDDGRRTLDVVLPIVIARQRDMLAVLSADEIDQLNGLMAKLAFAVPRWAPID